jgi:hypothetical protein
MTPASGLAERFVVEATRNGVHVRSRIPTRPIGRTEAPPTVHSRDGGKTIHCRLSRTAHGPVRTSTGAYNPAPKVSMDHSAPVISDGEVATVPA